MEKHTILDKERHHLLEHGPATLNGSTEFAWPGTGIYIFIYICLPVWRPLMRKQLALWQDFIGKLAH